MNKEFVDTSRQEFVADGTSGRLTENATFNVRNLRTEESVHGKRRFLLIYAPFGPFSRELAAELRVSGADVTRVLLNGGDVFDWGMRDAVPFFGAWSDWASWLAALVHRERFTDIVTYGDSSPHANLTLSLAPELGVRTHVLEQGYFRPDWVTLETRGVNANSCLPRDPSWYRNHPAAQRSPKVEIVGRSMPSAVRYITAYHLAMYSGAIFFPRYRAYYRDPAFKQAFGHMFRHVQQSLNRSQNQRAYEKIVQKDAPVFLCALQRPGDSQLWRHSDYASIPVFLEHVLTSFAMSAPENAGLLIRPHPLDPGLVPYGSLIRNIARRQGIEERVCLSDYGKMHEILPRMAGVVCVNSTAGLAAIEFGTPTITLGRAIYDMPGLTHQGDLDGFWKAPQTPDAELYLAFRHVVIAETQINGAYATAKGRHLAIPEIARRLLAPESI